MTEAMAGLHAWVKWLDLPARPRWLSLLAGIMIGLAQPPFGFLPGLFGYALLLWLFERDLGTTPKRTLFFMGWLAGFGYFFVSCFWVAEAFLVDADTYGWMAIPAATALPAGIALFWGLFAVLYRWFAPSGVKRFLYFAALFSAFEMLRGWIFSGFPWNPAGATWLAGSAMSQIAAYVGVYGLSFLTVAIFCSLGVVRRGMGVKGYAPVIWAGLVLAGCFGVGLYRLETTHVTFTSYTVRVVQPNIGQRAKWDRDGFRPVFMDYVRMTRAAPAPGKPWPDLVVWPEGALPTSSDDLLADKTWTAPIMANLLRKNQALIFGAYRADYDRMGRSVWRNSMIVTADHENVFTVEGFYNKFKLVPFGEFLPYEDVLQAVGFKELVHIGDGFTPGDRTAPVAFGSIPRFLPLICYEGIFPSLDMTDYSGKHARLRPKWILNISNDAWFGPTTGPRQHLNQASYRAIEEGLPLVRSTPTGISVLVDPLGRIVPGTKIDTSVRAFRDMPIPAALSVTPYGRTKNLLQVVIACLCLFFVTIETCVRVIKRNLALR